MKVLHHRHRIAMPAYTKVMPIAQTAVYPHTEGSPVMQIQGRSTHSYKQKEENND